MARTDRGTRQTPPKQAEAKPVETQQAAQPTYHKFRRLAGKHYYREGGALVCIAPGAFRLAAPGSFENDPCWEDCGPTTAPLSSEGTIPAITTPDKTQVEVAALLKKHRGGGRYDVVNAVTGQAINNAPLNKQQAEELVNASVDSK